MSKVLEKNEVLTLGFGAQTLNGKPYNHTGIDLVGEGMTACHIKSLMSGHVVEKGFQANGYGNYVVIDHENGYETRYAHLADPAGVNKGDHVEEGQLIGYMGATGYAFGVHLHFEIISAAIGFRVIDPTEYILGDKKLPSNSKENNQENNSQNEQGEEIKYKIGDRVVFSSYYASSTDSIEKAYIAKSYITGTITNINAGSRNPYLIDNGRCWCNNGDIRGYADNNTTEPKQEYAHKVGELVVYSSCYRGNNDVPPNYIDCIQSYGAWQQRNIVEIVGGSNPYKLDNGLYVNDGDIRQVK